MTKMKYKGGYKYQLQTTLEHKIEELPFLKEENPSGKFIVLDKKK